LLEPRSFDGYKNATAPMIAILDHLKVNTKVSDAGMKTMESDDCKEKLGDDGDTNSVLVII